MHISIAASYVRTLLYVLGKAESQKTADVEKVKLQYYIHACNMKFVNSYIYAW